MVNEVTWRLESHCCRVCFGRVLSRPTPSGGRVYRCADCGIEKEGSRPHVLCACGAQLNARNASIRCVANEKKTAEFPFEICAQQA